MVGPCRRPGGACGRERSAGVPWASMRPASRIAIAVAIFGLFHEMRGDDDRHALLGQRRDPPPELAPRQRIGAAGRLVEEQDLAARAAAPPPSPGAACSRPAIARSASCISGFSSNCRERPGDALALAAAAKPVGAGEEIQVLGDRELPVERELLRHVADALPGRRARGAQIEPATRSVPPVAGSRPQSMRNVVVLPAPFGPSRPKISPRRTSKLTWSTAVKAPNLRTRSRTSMTISSALPSGATGRSGMPDAAGGLPLPSAAATAP